MAYDFFGRQLKWFTRAITPCLIGAFLLASMGLIRYALLPGYREGGIWRGAVAYGLVGAIIGIFNGIFIEWPPSSETQKLGILDMFDWKGCLIGFSIALCTWSSMFLVLHPELVIEGTAILAPIGGIAGSIWRFINWTPLSSDSANEAPTLRPHQLSFSWWGCLLGLCLAFLLGFTIRYVLNDTIENALENALKEGVYLLPTGIIAGGCWHFFRREPASSSNPPRFSWRGCLIGLISSFVFSFASTFVLTLMLSTFSNSINAAVLAAAIIGPAGAVVGGISCFFFWHVDRLPDKQLAGIGALLTLAGFLLQLLPIIASMLLYR